MLYLAVWLDVDFFCAALSRKPSVVRVAMIENVVIIFDFHNAAVIVCSRNDWHIGFFVAVDSKVAVAHDYAAINKIARRLVACCIAKLVTDFGRIDKIVFVADFAD